MSSKDRQATTIEKLRRSEEGEWIEFEPDEAEIAGAFVEDAIDAADIDPSDR